MLVVVSLAALGIGVVALSSSGPARAAVPRSASLPRWALPRLAALRHAFAVPQPQRPQRVLRAMRPLRAMRAQLAEPCFVAAGSCSIHPCAQFAGASPAVAITSQTVVKTPTVIVPRPAKPHCLPQAQRVSAVAVTGAVATPVLSATRRLRAVRSVKR